MASGAVSEGKALQRGKRQPTKPRVIPGAQRKPALSIPRRCYQTTKDPAVGFNLASWWNFGKDGPRVWQDAVQDLFDRGFRHVTFVHPRFVNPKTWELSTTENPRLPELSHIEAGVVRAKELGMTTAISLCLETEGFVRWRGELQPEDAEVNLLFGNYSGYVARIARLAETRKVDRLTIGSELELLVRNPELTHHWGFLIAAARKSFSGFLGYAANWTDYDDVNLVTAVWDHPEIDFIGINAYFPLATEADADASGPHPDERFISTIRRKWNAIFKGLLDFARSRQGGKGLPVVFTEFGLEPYSRSTTEPWGVPNGAASPDPDEQVNAYDALLQATRGLGSHLHEITFWHWGMPGSEGSAWYTHPNPPKKLPNQTVDPSLGRHAGKFLAGFVSRPASTD